MRWGLLCVSGELQGWPCVPIWARWTNGTFCSTFWQTGVFCWQNHFPWWAVLVGPIMVAMRIGGVGRYPKASRNLHNFFKWQLIVDHFRIQSLILPNLTASLTHFHLSWRAEISTEIWCCLLKTLGDRESQNWSLVQIWAWWNFGSHFLMNSKTTQRVSKLAFGSNLGLVELWQPFS